MRDPRFNFQDIQDPIVRRNIQNLADYVKQALAIFSGFQFMELVFTQATANYRPTHTLGLIPLDVLLSQVTGVGSVTFNYGLFDEQNLDISVNGPCRVRFFYGTQPTPARVNAKTADAQTYNPGG